MVSPDCLSEILSRTSPRDACRAASVAKVFNSAAESNVVWERFLPPDYRQVIATAVISQQLLEHKKQLYLFLSNSHIILDLDRPYLSFRLDKESGKKCYMLGAKELSIAWQDDTRRRHWEWGPIPESRFPEVCTLRQVWWLGIQGKIAAMMLSPRTTYVAFLVFRTTRDSRGLDVAAKTKVSVGGIEIETQNVYLERPGDTTVSVTEPVTQQENPVFPSRRKDGWMEIKLGEFECNENDDGEIEMAFDEHVSWKTGLIVEGIELRPK